MMEKLEAYEALADRHFDSDRFAEFRADQLGDLDEVMWEYIRSPEFDSLLVQTVRTTFPAHEHDHFIGHYRGLMQHWVEAENPGGS